MIAWRWMQTTLSSDNKHLVSQQEVKRVGKDASISFILSSELSRKESEWWITSCTDREWSCYVCSVGSDYQGVVEHRSNRYRHSKLMVPTTIIIKHHRAADSCYLMDSGVEDISIGIQTTVRSNVVVATCRGRESDRLIVKISVDWAVPTTAKDQAVASQCWCVEWSSRGWGS